MAMPTTPERLSIMAGVLAVISATVPRYMADGHQERLILILMTFGVVMIAAVVIWRTLAPEARRQVPGLLGRLLIMLMLGGGLMAFWQAFRGDVEPLLLLSHGTTLGLGLHALTLGWQRRTT